MNSCEGQVKMYPVQQPLGSFKTLHNYRLCNLLLTEINFTLNDRENVGYYSLTIVTFVFQVLITLLFLILILLPTVTVFCSYTVMTGDTRNSD